MAKSSKPKQKNPAEQNLQAWQRGKEIGSPGKKKKRDKRDEGRQAWEDDDHIECQPDESETE
jgi:hypothetical protein